jgi:hypothetical protein
MSLLLSPIEVGCACIDFIVSGDRVDSTDWAPLALGRNTRHSPGFNFGGNANTYEKPTKMNADW